MKLTQTDIDRFWSYVDIKGPDDCWLWLGGKHRDGHGVLNLSVGKTAAAHRCSFFIENGYLPNIKNKRMVLHDCETPACQNPNHLIDGTAKQNNNYPNSKRGRSGERNGNNKISEAVARSILNAKGKQTAIAKAHNVSTFLVSAIKRGTRWKHIHD